MEFSRIGEFYLDKEWEGRGLTQMEWDFSESNEIG